MSTPNRPRKPYPKCRQARKTVFSATQWARWLSEQPWATPNPDEQRIRLRAGIEEFRCRVNHERDIKKRITEVAGGTQ